MTSVSVQARKGKFQLKVRDPLLPRPFISTFDVEREARDYGEHLRKLFARGIVPAEMLAPAAATTDKRLDLLIRDFLDMGSPAPSDRPMLERLREELGNVRLQAVTAAWADRWVSDMKIGKQLAPGTIRKRVESVARALDWWWRRRELVHGEPAPKNPLRGLPRGYSVANQVEAELLKGQGVEPRVDVQRDRRLTPAEAQRVELALSGVKREDRERALPYDPAFALFYLLIVNSGLRLSEAFTLPVARVKREGFIELDGSKGHRGKVKRRLVPLIPALAGPLIEWCTGREGLVFPFWDGTKEDKARCSSRLSSRFKTLFTYANVADFVEHDLRHEATCRWFEMRRSDGAWLFSETEICKIMGWTDMRMALRYASLRGEDLVKRFSQLVAAPAAAVEPSPAG